MRFRRALAVTAATGGLVAASLAPAHAGTDFDGDEVVLSDAFGAELEHRRWRAKPDPRVDYARAPLCNVNSEHLSPGIDGPCEPPNGTVPVPGCGEDEPVMPLWRRTRSTPTSTDWSRWEMLSGWACPDDLLPTFTERDLRRLPIEPLTAHRQPSGDEALVNKPLIVYADPVDRTFRTDLFGFGIDVVVYPVGFTWDFGDGATLATSDPGAPYPSFDVAHTYTETLTARVTLTTTWEGRYRVDEDPKREWRDITGTATTGHRCRPSPSSSCAAASSADRLRPVPTPPHAAPRATPEEGQGNPTPEPGVSLMVRFAPCAGAFPRRVVSAVLFPHIDAVSGGRVMVKVAGWISHRYVKYLVIVFWVGMLALLAPLAGKLGDAENNEAASWLPKDAESTQVLERAEQFVPDETLPAVVVYERPGGLTPADEEAIAADAQAFAGLENVAGEVVGPQVSEDGEAAQVIVPVWMEDWDLAVDLVDGIRAQAADAPVGLEQHVTGPVGGAADSAAAFEGIDDTLLIAAASVVFVILLLTYRSPVLWLLPIVSAVVALVASQAVVYLLAEYADLTVNTQSSSILTVLVFGAGTDYALLLTARYREELRRHGDRHAAMAVALHRASPAIIASGATVAVGMLCLLFATMSSTSGLGPVVAAGIVVCLLVMLTLLPALLVLVGRWVFWPRVPHLGDAEPTEHGFWARVGERIAVRPRRVWVGTAAVLAVATVGIVQLNATGLSTEDSFTSEQPSIVGEKVLARHFSAGTGTPVVVLSDAAGADAVRAAFAGTEGIDPQSVTEPVVIDGTAYLEGTLTSEPDSDEAFDTIDRVRDAVHAVPGADAVVGGETATNLDAQRASARDNLVVIPVILLAVLLILVLLLRSLVAPLVLMGTVVLSFGAAIGASALIFRHVFGFAGADSSFPLFVFVFLVALGIDYNIFLMTRVREEVQRVGHRRGTLVGLAATGGVITSAGLVLAGTFATLATLPVVAFVEIGFAVALGVLLDTLIVRSVLVTALNLDVGPRMWWPSRLARDPEPEPAPAVERVPARV